MPWIDDVVSLATIQSVWGNTIRNRVVHLATDDADFNAQANIAPLNTIIGKASDLTYWVKTSSGMYELFRLRNRTYNPGFFCATYPITSTGVYRLRGGWCDAFVTGTNNGSSVGSGAIVGNPPAPPAVAAGEVIGAGRINLSGSIVTFQAVAAANGQFTLNTTDAWPIGVGRDIGAGWPTTLLNTGSHWSALLSYPTTAI